jgi:hypothetical protein
VLLGVLMPSNGLPTPSLESDGIPMLALKEGIPICKDGMPVCFCILLAEGAAEIDGIGTNDMDRYTGSSSSYKLVIFMVEANDIVSAVPGCGV